MARRRRPGRTQGQRQRRSHQPRRRRKGRTVYVVLAGVAVAVVGWLTLRPFVSGGVGQERGRVILVKADMAGFQPKVIRATAGETITLELKSLDTPFHTDGGGKHQLAIDALGVDLIAPPGGTRKATLTVSEPGVYPFYCSVCCGGKANPSMWGRLIVRA